MSRFAIHAVKNHAASLPRYLMQTQGINFINGIKDSRGLINLFGAGKDGLMWSRDMGETWTSIGLKGKRLWTFSLDRDSIGAISLYVGTEPDTVFRSVDSGRTWTTFLISKFTVGATPVVHDRSGKTIVLASLNGGGILRTQDDGKSWQRIAGLPDSCITTMQNMPLADGSWMLLAGSESHGVFRSTDCGDKWAVVNNGLRDSSITAIAACSSPLCGVFIIVGTKHRGLFRSTDFCESWVEANDGLRGRTVRRIGTSLPAEGAVEKMTRPTVFALTDAGTFQSIDIGEHWSPLTASRVAKRPDQSLIRTFGFSIGVATTVWDWTRGGAKVAGVQSKPGLDLEGFVEWGITPIFSVQSGAQFVQRGMKHTIQQPGAGGGTRITSRLDDLSLVVLPRARIETGFGEAYALAGISLHATLSRKVTADGPGVSGDFSLENYKSFFDCVKTPLFGLSLGVGGRIDTSLPVVAGIEFRCSLPLHAPYDSAYGRLQWSSYELTIMIARRIVK